MELIVAKCEDYTVFKIDAGAVPDEEREPLTEKLREVVSGASKLLIDLSSLNYANSQFLGLLLFAHKAITKKKGKFALLCPKGRVLDLIRITSMIKVFTIYQDLDAFKQSPLK